MPALQTVSQWIGISLISGIWQGCILAAAVWICLRLVPKTTPTLRFAIWSVVFLLVALLPLVENLPHSGEVLLAHSSSLSQPHALLHLDVHWSLGLALVWAAFSLVRALLLARNVLRLRSLARRSVPISLPAAYEPLLNGGLRRIALCTSAEIDRPSVIGFFSPRILIPDWLYDQLTASELKQIVLHETEHLRRGDDWLNLLQKCCLVLFPLNPALQWIERRLCLERELACDDGVLRRTQSPYEYATCLTNLAERSLDRRTASLALGALGTTERQSEFSRRVHRILRRERPLSRLQERALAGGVAALLLAGVFGLAHCPRIVSFTTPPSPQTRASASVVARDNSMASGSMESGLKAIPVLYTDPATQRATLLKASTPAGAGKKPLKKLTAKRIHHRPAAMVERIAAAPVRRTQSWVVLTSANTDPQPAQGAAEQARPRTILSVADRGFIFHSYAAVRVDGGWLIVQL